jgi:hypothetical protein
MSRPARDALEGEGLLGAATGTSPLNKAESAHRSLRHEARQDAAPSFSIYI